LFPEHLAMGKRPTTTGRGDPSSTALPQKGSGVHLADRRTSSSNSGFWDHMTLPSYPALSKATDGDFVPPVDQTPRNIGPARTGYPGLLRPRLDPTAIS
jgi:hypothetical protein